MNTAANTMDELTGLLTRAAFVEQAQAAARAEEHLMLVFLDLDHFLGFNETYGHAVGDDWLRAVTERFTQAFGTDGLVGRYGGDELVALVKTADLYPVYEQAEALRRGMEENGPEVTVEGQRVHPGFTVSLGLADYPGSAGDLNDLLEKGKEAMLRAKQAGGNQVRFYKETDTLTGVLNRYASQRALEDALARARRERQSLAVLLVDLDRFAEINDSYGRRAGDEVLRRVAHMLENNFKQGSVGRLGGDEFIVILPGEQADSTFVLAEEVRRLAGDSEVRGQVGGSPFSLRFTLTGGIAVYPGDGSDRVDLLRKADEALYRAKRIGRNRICLPANAQMVTKTSHYTQIQLERLAALAQQLERTEAFLLREALDDLLRKYEEQ